MSDLTSNVCKYFLSLSVFVFISAQQRLELDDTLVDGRALAETGSSSRPCWARGWWKLKVVRIRMRIFSLLGVWAVKGREVEHVVVAGLLHYRRERVGLFPGQHWARSREKVAQRPGNIPGTCNRCRVFCSIYWYIINYLFWRTIFGAISGHGERCGSPVWKSIDQSFSPSNRWKVEFSPSSLPFFGCQQTFDLLNTFFLKINL